ncbi:HNH endonuclease [Pelomonas sp. P7]|uniref:HNH endonuclease n=1 Tax=Pelomonas caseinilytica TaxID=2906763 RepID=A0ABS8XU76_9BURK|nr:HNH endonuclease signature motif containing protein [Pelomonas sp. P7]MCE4540780.1 HNH endonuclease [Pelomonas sp. P7]
MPRLLIKIKWRHGTEFVSVDPDFLPSAGTYLKTTECWKESEEVVKYDVLCRAASRHGDRIEMDLRYAQADNPHLAEKNDAWGRCGLVIDVANSRATARWSDVQVASYNGPGRCVVLEDSLLDEYTYQQILRKGRPKQSAMRRQLLQMYGCCALTGETTREVLDAAHIVEVDNNGGNSRANCFLLRTDLHRLFDRGLLTFSATGQAIFAPSVGRGYVDELSGRRLADDVLDNVGEALRMRGAASR